VHLLPSDLDDRRESTLFSIVQVIQRSRK